MSEEIGRVDPEQKVVEARRILETMIAVLAEAPPVAERSATDLLVLHGDLAHLRDQFFAVFTEVMDYRNSLVISLHEQGVSLSQLAEVVGVTVARIHDIIAEHRDEVSKNEKNAAASSDSRDYMVMTFHEKGESDSKIAELTGLSVREIRTIIDSHAQRARTEELVRVLHGHNVSADEIATAVGLTRSEVDEILTVLNEGPS